MQATHLEDDLRIDSAMSLTQARVGCDFRIAWLHDGPESDQLREMGFCERMRVRKLTDGRNLLCLVCGARLAISRELAQRIMVRPAA